MLELNQLGASGLDSNPNLYVHRDPLSYSNSESIRSIINEYATKLTGEYLRATFYVLKINLV